MIKINVDMLDKNIKEINIVGHAGYDMHGKDIVCSAVSSIVITSVNAILSFNVNYIDYIEKKDNFRIVINENNDIVDKLITNMLNLLSDLEKDYPNNIEIRRNIKC